MISRKVLRNEAMPNPTATIRDEMHLERSVPGRVTREFALVALITMMICCAGCGTLRELKKSRDGGKGLPRAIDPIQLRVGVRQVIDKSIARIVANATDIAVKTEDRKIRENTVRWKIRANDDFLAVLLEPDARIAFINGWTIAVQLRKSLTDGVSKDDFGAHQQSAIATMKAVEADFVDLGRENFSLEAIDAASDDIEALGSGGSFAASPTGKKESARKGVNDVLNMLRVPLMPVNALEAVSDTPTAINKFTEATQGIGAVMQQLPEKTRWQLELLFLEMGSTGWAASILSEVQALRATVNQTVATVQALPAEIRGEFEKSLAAVKETQPELTAMLNQAQSTIKELKATIQQAQATVEETRKLMGSLEKPAEQAVKVAESWQNSTKEVRGLIADWDAYSAKNDGSNEKKEDAISVRDYTEMAAEMREAAEQVRGLLADLGQPLSRTRAIHDVSAAANAAIDKVFQRAVLLILILATCK